MNTLMTMNTNEQMTMSSREIAELTGKQHKNVIRDIENMIQSITGDGSKLSHQQYQGLTVNIDLRGYVREVLLNRELTDCLLTGYSAKVRMIVIKRWHELEEQVSKPQLPDFNNPAAAARAWADECHSGWLKI